MIVLNLFKHFCVCVCVCICPTLNYHVFNLNFIFILHATLMVCFKANSAVPRHRTIEVIS